MRTIKSRRREFKAAYLTGAVVGGYVILSVPYMLGRILESAGRATRKARR